MARGGDRHRDFTWRTTRHVAEWLVAQVGPRPGDVILDLAGGPGDNGFLAAEAVGASGKASKNPWVTTIGMTLMQIGHEPRYDPFGPGGMFSMSDAGTIRSLVSGAGFDVIEIEEMPVRWEYASLDEAWSFMTQVAGALATVVRDLPSDEVAAFRAALDANEEPFRTDDGGLAFPGLTINVVASQPGAPSGWLQP